MTMPDDTTLPNPLVGVYPAGSRSDWPDGAQRWQDVLSAIQDGFYFNGVNLKENTAEFRAAIAAAGSPLELEWAKRPKSRSFPAITVSAQPVPAPWGDRQWLGRDEGCVPTGLYAYDIDGIWTPSPDGRTPAEWLRDTIAEDLQPEAAWVSVSGRGVCVVFGAAPAAAETHADLKAAHVDIWADVAENRLDPFLAQLQLDHDPAPKAVNSLRFIGHDPGLYRRTR